MPTMLDQPTESQAALKYQQDQAAAAQAELDKEKMWEDRKRVQAEAALRLTMEKDQQALKKGQQEAQEGTMRADVAQWAADPYYRDKDILATDEGRQHFMGGTYGGIEHKAPEAVRQTQSQVSGFIPGLQGMAPERVTVDDQGKATRTYKPTSESAVGIDPNLAGESAFLALPPEEQTIARAIAAYNQTPTQSLSRFKADARQRIMSTVQQANPAYDAKEYPIKQASRKAFTSGPQAARISSLNTVVNHLEGLLHSHEAMKNTSYPIVNKAWNAGAQQLGSPEKTKFEVNANAVAAELAKLMKGSGVPAAAEMKEWRESFDASMSPEQMKASVEKALELIAGGVDGLRNQWQSAYEEPRKLPFLDPQAQKILKRMGYDPKAIDPGDAQAAPSGSEKVGEIETGVPTKPTPAPSTGDKFKTGQTYKDAKGNTAVYLGDGKWKSQ